MSNEGIPGFGSHAPKPHNSNYIDGGGIPGFTHPTDHNNSTGLLDFLNHITGGVSGNLTDTAQGAATAGAGFLDKFFSDFMAANKAPKPKKHKAHTAAPYVDPRQAFVNALLAPQQQIDTNSKQYKRDSQKQINNALLAARHPWDGAIVDTRAGLKNATAAIDNAAMGVDPMMQGTARGLDALAQSDQHSLDTARDASLARQAQDSIDTAHALGISPEQAAAAGATANTATQATTAGQLGDVNRRTDAAKGMAGTIAQASKLQSQESKQGLIKDAEREVNRLRSQRATSMAGAKASVEQQIAQFIQEQAGQSSDAAYKNASLAATMMNAMSNDAIQMQGQADHRASATMSAKQKAAAAAAGACRLRSSR